GAPVNERWGSSEGRGTGAGTGATLLLLEGEVAPAGEPEGGDRGHEEPVGPVDDVLADDQLQHDDHGRHDAGDEEGLAPPDRELRQVRVEHLAGDDRPGRGQAEEARDAGPEEADVP